MNSFYPEVCRNEILGTNIYMQLSTPENKNWGADAFGLEVPYIEAVKREATCLENSGASKERIFIVTKNEYVAEKVARFIENNGEIFQSKQKNSLQNGMDLNDRNGVEFNYGNSVDLNYEDSMFYKEVFGDNAQMDEVPLYAFLMESMSDKNRMLRSIYLQMLDGGPKAKESVLFTGLQNGQDSEEKARAILARQKGHIYIWIYPNQMNAKWVKDLIMEHQFGTVEIPEVPIEYYEAVLRLKMKESGYVLSKEIEERELLQAMVAYKGDGFREESITWMVDHAIRLCEKKSLEENVLKWEDFELGDKLQAWNTLMSMPGLIRAKEKFVELMAISKERFANPKLETFHVNMIVCGNPGTGKTEFGRLLGRYLSECGLCDGNFVIANRADLIGEYVGMTAKLVEKQFERAKGGVLFVDEAGFFLNRNSGGYVDEAIKEFVRFMEMYPETLVVFSMYEREAISFMELDEGIASRISDVIRFEDYSDEELIDIAKFMVEKRGYRCELNTCEFLIRQYIKKKRKDKYFGNAREMRKLVESCISKHAVSVWNDKKEFDPIITKGDVESAIASLSSFSIERKEVIGF